MAPGEIVTANHVVKGEDSAVIVYGSERDEGLVVARNVDADLAIIRTELKGSPLTLRIGKPDVGADVRAVGYPEGSLSVTQGIVSGFRSLDGFKYLQTDAAVNGGSSGGPLIDSSGRVVGVIVSKVENAEGLAYAVPADVVRKLSASVADGPSRDQPLALPSHRGMPPPAGRSQVWWLFLPLTLGLGAILARRSRRSSERRRHHIVISKHDLR